VSRQTVINDFPETEGYLKNNSISVERVQGAGIYITGSEENIRHAFIQVLADSECSIAVLTRLNEVSFIIIIF
jgi:transcriptional antiterminator